MRTVWWSSIVLGLSALSGVACAPKGRTYPPREPVVLSTHTNAKEAAPNEGVLRERAGQPSETRVEEVGLASWYGSELAGHPTANGERFDPRSFTAAHKHLRFGTWVEVRRIDTGRTVRVRINDRGPNGASSGRVIDLSQRAAEDLDIVRAGVVRVELRIVSGP